MGSCFCKDVADIADSKDEHTHIPPGKLDANGSVGKFTSANLSDHNAAFDADAVLLPHSGTTPAITKTLANDDPEMALKRAAYLARKERKQSRTKVGSQDFLSGLPEVETDVHYRFNFVVVGHVAGAVMETVCNSAAASGMPRELLDKDNAKEELFPSPTSAPGEGKLAGAPSRRASNPQIAKTYRCLCMVTNPMAPESKAHRKMAKLVFNPKDFGQEVPMCNSRLEALRSVVVFMLNVGDVGADGKAMSFDAQLTCLSEVIDDMRARSRPKSRPVRAIILCYPKGTAEKVGQDGSGWTSSLADFEQKTGDLWKFGPISIGDADGLHDVFTEMASVRIAHYENVEAAGGKDDDDGKEGEEERNSQVLQDFLMPVPENGNIQQGRISRSDSMSECSEGGERPPFFGAECSGSDCSESALELHARTFGLETAEDSEGTDKF